MKDLSMHILDILQNYIVANATFIELEIYEDIDKDLFKIIFNDNGKGMDEEMVKQVIDPFFTTRTTRRVGLGIPLLKQNAEQTGGTLNIESTLNKGTKITVTFSHKHLDRQPLGDIAGTIVLTASSHENINFIYKHSKNGNEYVFDTREIKKILEGVPLTNPQIIMYLKDMIKENLNAININF